PRSVQPGSRRLGRKRRHPRHPRKSSRRHPQSRPPRSLEPQSPQAPSLASAPFSSAYHGPTGSLPPSRDCHIRLPYASVSHAKEPTLLRTYRGHSPRIAESAYIDPQAVIIGDVPIAADSSVWPCVVIRGDVHFIRIGSRTNIQDGSVLHVMRDEHPLILGDNVTVGHGVVLHGCT